MVKKKNIYLHIGNFKTGTSAIQRFCSRHAAELRTHDLDYLAVARPSTNKTNHGQLPLSLYQKYQANIPDWYCDNVSYAEISQQILSAIEASSCNNILISSEEFYRIASFPQQVRDNIMQQLLTLFSSHNVSVLMYVRSPLSFAKSWYNQVNKADFPRRRFIDFFSDLPLAILLPCENAKLWRSTFGHGALKLIPYSKSGAQHIADFLLRIEIDNPPLTEDANRKINPRQNEAALEKRRLQRIWLLRSAEERAPYLRSSVLSSQHKIVQLERRIDLINREYNEFCAAEKLDPPPRTISLAKLLVHEEYINRKDLPSPSLSHRLTGQAKMVIAYSVKWLMKRIR